jgi:hypothetical protein
VSYHGKAEGGPLDGQRIAHYAPVYYVSVVESPQSPMGVYRTGSYTIDYSGDAAPKWTWKLL